MKVCQFADIFPPDVPTVVLAGDSVIFQGEFAKAVKEETIKGREVAKILPFVAQPGPVPNSMTIQPIMRIIVSQSASGIIL